jgi:hypothetical protein
MAEVAAVACDQVGVNRFLLAAGRRRSTTMNIYRLYIENGNRAGFWVQHRTWRDRCAQVLSIDGQNLGRLPGSSPAHNHAAVVIQCFDVRGGRALPATTPSLEDPEDQGYVAIAEPPWHRERSATRGSNDVTAMRHAKAKEPEYETTE